MATAEKILHRMMVLGLGFLGTTGLVNKTLFCVFPGERAIVFDRMTGVKNKVYGEGLHFRIPLIQSIIKYEIRTRPFVYHTLTQTKDLQRIDISLRVLYSPEVGELPRIYNDIGENYAERVFPSIGNEIMKSVVALKTAEELTTQREKVSAELRETLS